MKTGHVTLRVHLILSVVLVAVAGTLRLIRLSWPPLSDKEAGQAMAALEGLPGTSDAWLATVEDLSPSPAYRTATQALFQVLGSSDAAARAVPALFGVGIVLLPLFLGRKVGHGAGLAAAALLAISPSMTAASRHAGGETVAVFALAGTVVWMVGRHKQANLSLVWGLLGLGLAAGHSFYTGALTVGLGGVLFWLLTTRWTELRQHWPEVGDIASGWWLLPLVAVGLATGLGFRLAWFYDLFGAVQAWLAGWGTSGGIQGLTQLAILLMYEPLILVLGIAGAVIAVRRRDVMGLAAGCWTLGALVVVVVYPSRQPQDMGWILVPLSLLAGRSLVALIDLPDRPESRAERAGLGLGFLVMMGYLYLQLAASADVSAAGDVESATLRLGVSAAVFAAVLLATLILGYLWSWEDVWSSLGRAGAVLLLALTISASWRISLGPSAEGAGELWRPQGSTFGLKQLQHTIERLSLLETGTPDLLAMEVVGDPPPALAWALRSMQRARLGVGLPGVSGRVILAPEHTAMFGPDQGFLGQSLTIGERWGWEGATPPQIVRWWFKRGLPTIQDRWTVWVRADLIE